MKVLRLGLQHFKCFSKVGASVHASSGNAKAKCVALDKKELLKVGLRNDSKRDRLPGRWQNTMNKALDSWSWQDFYRVSIANDDLEFDHALRRLSCNHNATCSAPFCTTHGEEATTWKKKFRLLYGLVLCFVIPRVQSSASGVDGDDGFLSAFDIPL